LPWLLWSEDELNEGIECATLMKYIRFGWNWVMMGRWIDGLCETWKSFGSERQWRFGFGLGFCPNKEGR
jgi:hypothetical protein